MQVLAPLLELSARGRQEVDVRVARPPAFRGQVGEALIRSVSSRWPGSIRTVCRSGSYSNPRATSTTTSPRGSQPWQVPSM